ncbi:hypothetical protein TNCV_4059951 [Trichonephila clavipes]|nr:hypothetical protein TNCV_4059951 [Trichonephila clavipes]
MRNPDMTGAIARILVSRLFCTRYRTISLLFGVLTIRSCSCMSTRKDPLSDNLCCKRTNQVLSEICILKLGVQPLCGASIVISDPECQMHISKLSVRVTIHSTTTVSADKMKLRSEHGTKNCFTAYATPFIVYKKGVKLKG